MVSSEEIDRQFRVSQQMLSMHSFLRDEFTFKAKFAELVLLGCSVVFCATAFAGDDFYQFFGLTTAFGRIVLGIASVLAFIATLSLLILDWRGSAARHGEAANRWSNVLALFRESQHPTDGWREEVRKTLSAAYWEASRNSVKVPEKRFNHLKARHLRKVEISKLLSKYPGCPRFLLWIVVLVRDVWRAIKTTLGKE